jgi:predicted cation transporter
MITPILIVIFFIILLFPLFIKKVEHNLELFLFITGSVTLLLSHLLGPEPLLTMRLVESAFMEPVKITVATLIFGLAFRAIREPMKKKIVIVEHRLGPRPFAFLLIFVLGLISSVITAIITALILCEVVSAINLDKKYETRLVIFACFSIGMGAALTPIGEPLSTIAVAKLRGGVMGGDFMMLVRNFGAYIIPGLVLISLVGGFCRGTGFKPLIDAYISKIPAPLLYWVNITSAILDNATLAAAELGPLMTVAQVKGILMGIIISGGMLIPGNIPNIIAANKLKISSRVWAATGVPFGILLMALYFAILYR